MVASLAASCSTREPIAGCTAPGSSDVGGTPVDGAADTQRSEAQDVFAADRAPDEQASEDVTDATTVNASADSQSFDATSDDQALDAGQVSVLDAAGDVPAVDGPGPGADAGCTSEPPNLDAATEAGARCPAVIDSPPLMPGVHVPIGSAIPWCSNPPSSGQHYPIWAAYQAYDMPVPRGYYVHDLEHGAIVFLYNCGHAGCPDIVAALRAAADAIPSDPICDADAGVRVRAVITPDPLLDVPVAAAAWGWTYKAQCVDLAALTAFAREHYGHGPEILCANGTTQF